MKDIKVNYKLAFLIPTAALLLSCNAKKSNVVICASPNQIIVKDLEDGQERLFIGPNDTYFQYLRTNDTVDIYISRTDFGKAFAEYNGKRIFTNTQEHGITNISLEKARLRFIKENWQNAKTK